MRVSSPFDELEIRGESATLRVAPDRVFLDVIDVSAYGELASRRPLWDLVQTMAMTPGDSGVGRKTWVAELSNGTATVSRITVESGGRAVEKWELRLRQSEPRPMSAFGSDLARVEPAIPPETRTLSIWSSTGGLVELQLKDRKVTSSYLAYPGRPEIRDPSVDSHG